MSLQPLLFAQEGYSVEPIPASDATWLILNRHYARRLPIITHSYGLFSDGDLRGVVTYGPPVSRPLCMGIAGPAWSANVLELNRLVLVDNRPNEASRLIGGSLRLLNGPLIVISYADTSQHHLGTVYQATNWLYTGLSALRTDLVLEGTNLHTRTLAADRQKYGDKIKVVPRSRKHRYIKLVGNRAEKKAMRKALRYEVVPYPTTRQSKLDRLTQQVAEEGNNENTDTGTGTADSVS